MLIHRCSSQKKNLLFFICSSTRIPKIHHHPSLKPRITRLNNIGFGRDMSFHLRLLFKTFESDLENLKHRPWNMRNTLIWYKGEGYGMRKRHRDVGWNHMRHRRRVIGEGGVTEWLLLKWTLLMLLYWNLRWCWVFVTMSVYVSFCYFGSLILTCIRHK